MRRKLLFAIIPILLLSLVGPYFILSSGIINQISNSASFSLPNLNNNPLVSIQEIVTNKDQYSDKKVKVNGILTWTGYEYALIDENGYRLSINELPEQDIRTYNIGSRYSAEGYLRNLPSKNNYLKNTIRWGAHYEPGPPPSRISALTIDYIDVSELTESVTVIIYVGSKSTIVFEETYEKQSRIVKTIPKTDLPNVLVAVTLKIDHSFFGNLEREILFIHTAEGDHPHASSEGLRFDLEFVLVPTSMDKIN